MRFPLQVPLRSLLSLVCVVLLTACSGAGAPSDPNRRAAGLPARGARGLPRARRGSGGAGSSWRPSCPHQKGLHRRACRRGRGEREHLSRKVVGEGSW